MVSSPLTMANCSSLESTPILRSIVAWAMEPRMSWRHSRQSNETDSVNRATSAPGSPRNLPLRESGELFFIPLFAPESARNTPESHAGKADTKLRRIRNVQENERGRVGTGGGDGRQERLVPGTRSIQTRQGG